MVHEGSFEFLGSHDWTVDALVGLVYSTSFLNPRALGAHAAAFEHDLRARLLDCEPHGVFRETTSFRYELARNVEPADGERQSP